VTDFVFDHLVYAVPDLDLGTRYVEELLGVRSSPGGRHRGYGSRNRLIGLGPSSYLEIVSVDPSQRPSGWPRWFGLDDLHESRLVTWCMKSDDLSGLVARARDVGLDLGDPIVASRVRADGTELRWTFTDPASDRAGGVVPFFIDWGLSEHPARRLSTECSVGDLRFEHPDPEPVQAGLRALGVSAAVGRGDSPRVFATIESPNGTAELA